MGLTWRQERFALAYFQDPNATKAAIRAGYSENSAQEQGSKLLSNPMILQLIEGHEEDAAYAATLTQARVLKEMMQIAFADPGELVRVQVDSCARCYDADTRDMLIASGLRASLKIPNPDCEWCRGDGQKFVWLADTAKLSPAARKLFAGAVQTKEGIKILLKDQIPMLMALGKITGLIREKTEISGPGGGPVSLLNITATDLTDEQLLALASAGNGTLGVHSGVSLAPALPSSTGPTT